MRPVARNTVSRERSLRPRSSGRPHFTTSRPVAIQSPGSRGTRPVPVTMPPPAPAPGTTDFNLGANPATPVLPADGSVVVNLALYQNGAADADAVATVTVAGLPAGVTAEFRPGNPADTTAGVLSRTETGTLTLRASGAAAGTHRP